jgi:hypothetical protein
MYRLIMTSNATKSFLDNGPSQTEGPLRAPLHMLFETFLGAATFGFYTRFVLMDLMNEHIQKQTTVIKEMQTIDVEQKRLIHDLKNIHTSQTKIIQRLETKLNTRWW